VLTRAGNALPLPGLEAHPMLSRRSPVLVVAARFRTGHTFATFLCPDAADATRNHLRVLVLECHVRSPGHLSGVVVVSQPADVHGLTRPEPEILGMLIEDWPLLRISGALAMDEGNLAGHLESIQHKLAARTRDVATLRALRCGLYVPSELARLPR
jgi:DNA-binding CsgD family transcriptional regulator